jgi:Ni/Fe-hydrogenase subunit HybB-like protein
MMWLIAAFLLLRLLPVVLGGHSALAFTASRDSLMFWLETGAFAAAIALLASDARRRSERTVFLAACAALAGGSLYRLNSWLIAYQGTAGWSYFPSVPELMVTIGMVCLEVLLYLVFVKSLPVLIQPVPRRNVNA